MKAGRVVCWVFVVLAFMGTPKAEAGYIQVAGLIDTRTIYSDGAHDVEFLAQLAKSRGFDVLFINDHDRLVMEYGLPPFRNLLRKREELNSICKIGPESYLKVIQGARERYPGLVLISGSETVPFYYWTGSYFSDNLTAHNHEKRILTIGLERPEDFRGLPILHNGPSTAFLSDLIWRPLFFFVPFLIGLLLIGQRGGFRIWGVLVSTLSLLLILDSHPFKSSPYSQYEGDRGIGPYQVVIDYVNSKGGLTFWNYPETTSGVRRMGPIHVNTPPYPEALEEARDYTGFAALYGNRITLTEPGRGWDRVLLQYCRGTRSRPVWGIATADFHKDGDLKQKLGDYPTVFLVREKTAGEVLSAIRAGRMYACHVRYPQQILLKEFSVGPADGGPRATIGEEIQMRGRPRIRISLDFKMPAPDRVAVRLIRSGELIKTFEGPLPMEIDYEDLSAHPAGKIFYRMDLKGHGRLVSNPIFVHFQK